MHYCQLIKWLDPSEQADYQAFRTYCLVSRAWHHQQADMCSGSEWLLVLWQLGLPIGTTAAIQGVNIWMLPVSSFKYRKSGQGGWCWFQDIWSPPWSQASSISPGTFLSLHVLFSPSHSETMIIFLSSQFVSRNWYDKKPTT